MVLEGQQYIGALGVLVSSFCYTKVNKVPGL